MKALTTEFNDYWPKLLKKIRNEAAYKDILQSLDWLDRVMKSNVPFGKQNRGLLFLELYQDLVPVRTPKQDEISYIIGWCIEIMQTSYLVADDMMDKSETRRGSPCWYLVPDVGLMAINDTLLLENLVYELLGETVEDKGTLLLLLQMFQKTSYKTILGQSLDTRVSMDKIYDKYTIEIYTAIVKYKTSFYTFYQPAALALILAGITEESKLKPVEDICLQMGHFFQVQDDYIDCYSDPELSGKVGTDIIDAKCSWLAVTALSLVNAEQKAIFEKSYGVNDKEAEKKIKELFSELKIPEKYAEFQNENYVKIMNGISKLSPEIPKKSFINIVQVLHKREK